MKNPFGLSPVVLIWVGALVLYLGAASSVSAQAKDVRDVIALLQMQASAVEKGDLAALD